MTEISVGFTIVIPGSLDPDMHFGLEVKWLTRDPGITIVNPTEISVMYGYAT